MVKQSLEKQPNPEQGHNILSLTPLMLIPADYLDKSCKSHGESVVELAPPKRT